MRINIDGPYQEGTAKRAYIVIAKIFIVTFIILTGFHVVNQLDDIMAHQRIQDKTMADCMDQLMWIRQDLDELKNSEAEIDDLSEDTLHYEQVFGIDEKVAVRRQNTANTTSIGEYTITHYCPCEKCRGETDAITATGTIATADRTIAVDPSVIPYGTEVIIDGKTYVAEDCGGAIKGNRIDVFCESHSEAINRGKITREVFKVEY